MTIEGRLFHKFLRHIVVLIFAGGIISPIVHIMTSLRKENTQKLEVLVSSDGTVMERKNMFSEDRTLDIPQKWWAYEINVDD